MARVKFYDRRMKAPAQMDVDPEKNKAKEGDRLIGDIECELATAHRMAKNLAAEVHEKNEVIVKVQDQNDKDWWDVEFRVQGLSSKNPDDARAEASLNKKKDKNLSVEVH
jgi:hypothetical protein